MMNKLAPYFELVLEAKRIGKPIIKSVQIDVTHTCYSKCLSCRQYEWPKTQLDLQTINEIAQDAKKMGCETFVISGGEPFAHVNIVEIIALLKTYGQVGIITSGIIPERRLDELKSHDIKCDWIMVSLDAHERELYKRVRGVDAFELVLQSIDLLRNFSIRQLRTNTVVSNLNYNFVVEIYDLVTRLGCYALFTPVHTWPEMMLSDEQWHELVTLIQQFDEHIDSAKTNLKQLKQKPVDLAPVCAMPFIHAVVDGYGYVYPCCRLSDDNGNFRNFEFAYGNVREQRFADLVSQKAPGYYNEPSRNALCKSCDRYRELNYEFWRYVSERRPIFL